MGSSRAGALCRAGQSAWQVSQIVAFGIFSSYAGFASLIAGVMNPSIFMFTQVLTQSPSPIIYNT